MYIDVLRVLGVPCTGTLYSVPVLDLVPVHVVTLVRATAVDTVLDLVLPVVGPL